MTENYSERIENALNDIKNIQALFRMRYGKECLADKEIEEVLKISKEEHEEIRQYRAIGTVEECREAMERQRGKKVEHITDMTTLGMLNGICPVCGETAHIDRGCKSDNSYCANCGQKLDWSDTP